MATVQDYKDLIVWQKAMELVEAVHGISRRFPRDEIYGLTRQVRRAAVAIPSNIAEGQGRQSTKEFRYYLSVARGSAQELETQLLLAQKLDYMNESDTQPLITSTSEVRRLLNGLLKSLPTP